MQCKERLYWNISCKTQLLNGTSPNCFIFSLWQLFTTYSELFHRKNMFTNLIYNYIAKISVEMLRHLITRKGHKIEMFHSFGSLVSRTYQQTHKMNIWYGSKDWNEDGDGETNQNYTLKNKKKQNKIPITLKNRQTKWNLVPQVQEVLLELCMRDDLGYKKHKL